jgi:hypothetical protein
MIVSMSVNINQDLAEVALLVQTAAISDANKLASIKST